MAALPDLQASGDNGIQVRYNANDARLTTTIYEHGGVVRSLKYDITQATPMKLFTRVATTEDERIAEVAAILGFLGKKGWTNSYCDSVALDETSYIMTLPSAVWASEFKHRDNKALLTLKQSVADGPDVLTFYPSDQDDETNASFGMPISPLVATVDRGIVNFGLGAIIHRNFPSTVYGVHTQHHPRYKPPDN